MIKPQSKLMIIFYKRLNFSLAHGMDLLMNGLDEYFFKPMLNLTNTMGTQLETKPNFINSISTTLAHPGLTKGR